MSAYNWKEINDRLVRAIRPSCNAVAFKYIKTPEQLKAVPGLRYWREPDSCVCKLIGLAAYLDAPFALEATYSSLHCADMNGLKKRGYEWENGIDLNSDPIKWHGLQADSAAHMRATAADLPSEDHIALVAAPLALGAVEDPDCIIISCDPGAAFHVLAALVEKDWREITFTFRGESSCAETWDHTYVTGEPGLSLGCRGDRCQGGLSGHEVRFTLSAKDLLKALDGMDRLASDGIVYPYYPDGVVVPQDLPTQ